MSTISTLLVDDNIYFLNAAMDFLAVDGQLNVVGLARSGVEAIEKVAQLTPALVLMDWSMPEMDGLAALRQLKSQVNPPHIIMLTQNDTAPYLSVAARAGADGFVSKANFGADLLPLINALCASSGEWRDDSSNTLSSLAVDDRAPQELRHA